MSDEATPIDPYCALCDVAKDKGWDVELVLRKNERLSLRIMKEGDLLASATSTMVPPKVFAALAKKAIQSLVQQGHLKAPRRPTPRRKPPPRQK